MGSLISKAKEEEKKVTPARECVLKHLEDPRSPTDEISRTPIEVADKQPKESTRHLAFANALKEQNKTVYESSPIYPRSERCDVKKIKIPFAAALDSIPVSQTNDSNSSSAFNISAIEKEN